MASYPRPPLLPWSAATWSERWAKQGRMANAPVPRTPFLLLKAPASTLYEEKYGGDRNVFTVAMYCGRMNARGIRVGLVVDCTALDLEEFEPLPAAKAPAASSSAKKFDRRVRYFHNSSEWDDYDVEYHRLLPPQSSDKGSSDEPNRMPIKFPSPNDLAKSQHRTLLDVVLVKDTERGNSTHRFYALDILCIEGGMVWHKPFDHRWKYLHEGVLIPRKKDESQPTTNHAYAREPIKVRAKEYFPMKKLGFVMNDVCAGVGHEAEGVRVVPVGDYGIGESKDSAKAVVWTRGCGVDDDQLKALLLAS